MASDHEETDEEREERIREEKREAQIMLEQCAVTRILDLSERQPHPVPTADQPLLSDVSLVINTPIENNAVVDNDACKESETGDTEEDR